MTSSNLILTTLICTLAMTGCSNSQAQLTTNSSTQTSNIKETNSSGETTGTISKPSLVQPLLGTRIETTSGYQCKSTNNYLFLGNGTMRNKYGNPIYPVSVCVGGKEVSSYQIVTGRNFTQQRNRDRSGTQSPLPNGKYRVGTALTPGLLVEVGKVEGLGVSQPFLPISPLFNTGRSALGFHVDPSYNKDPKEDGTSGCIGLTTSEDFKSLWADIKRYQIRDLQVAINTRAADNPNVAERQ